MVKQLTIEDLKENYGPVYDKLFNESFKPKNWKEIYAAKTMIDKHLIDNPTEIFETDKYDTIDEFVKIVDEIIKKKPESYSKEVHLEYIDLKYDWLDKVNAIRRYF